MPNVPGAVGEFPTVTQQKTMILTESILITIGPTVAMQQEDPWQNIRMQ